MNGKSISSTTSRNTATPVATAINSSSTNANSAPNPITASRIRGSDWGRCLYGFEPVKQVELLWLQRGGSGKTCESHFRAMPRPGRKLERRVRATVQGADASRRREKGLYGAYGYAPVETRDITDIATKAGGGGGVVTDRYDRS